MEVMLGQWYDCRLWVMLGNGDHLCSQRSHQADEKGQLSWHQPLPTSVGGLCHCELMECRCVSLVTHARLLPHVTILTGTTRVVILHSRPLPHVTILLMGTTRVVIIIFYTCIVGKFRGVHLLWTGTGALQHFMCSISQMCATMPSTCISMLILWIYIL